MPTEVIPHVEREQETQLQPPYHVILLDDDDHTYEYVIEMLGKIFGYAVPKAFEMAREVDLSGRCVVYTGSLEQAEFKRDKIHGYGADPRIARCAGSMTAVLEKAEG
jgi:ATP-dependent Clp protease adaptor protein ClpS